jgi:hypothetical protein
MKAGLTVIIAALVVWLIVVKRDSTSQTASDQKTITDLSNRLKAIEDNPSLELQSRCAEAALTFFKRFGYEPYQNADFTNHYNPKLRKCFIAIHTLDPKTAAPNVLTSQAVFDAVEGKNYGEYIWKSDQTKKYWEVAPLECDGTASDGSYKICHSEPEFNGLMSDYIDIESK